MAERKLSGKIAPERILMTALPKPAPDLIAGFRSLGDGSGWKVGDCPSATLQLGRSEVRETRSEVLLKPTVEQLHACLQQKVRALRRPSHLLTL